MGAISKFFKWLFEVLLGGSQSTTTVNNNINIGTTAGVTAEISSQPSKSNEPNYEVDFLKAHTNILFIDDEKFQITKTIQEAGWKNTYWLNGKTLKNTDTERIRQADIIFVDIVGVAGSLFEDEGLGLIVYLKKRYPSKIVILYSSESRHNIHHEAFDLIDDKMKKETRAGVFLAKIEKYAKKVHSKR